jgi:hypothetical protein
MAVKKVFVSYDHSEDALYRDLLRAWDANTDFDFEFDLRSPTVAIDSSEASVIHASLTKKMKEAEYILVIVGEKSHSSKWMKWEIERAKQNDTNLKFAAVKLKSVNANPPNLPYVTANASEFKLDKIIQALNNARRTN